ncbi:MAG: methyltransferase domain-containing protein [Kofleriaceae bacterium]
MASLRSTAILDEQFDRLVPRELQHLSSIHWTPVPVAIRIAALLCPTPRTFVLDVGSGVGKLCSIGALATQATWIGVERHGPFVSAARDIARSLGVTDRTMFVHGDAFAVDWGNFDVLYFYNPFELAFGDERTDRAGDAARVQKRLAALPGHTRIVTLHGFGGVMPSTFELLYHERLDEIGVDLALWRQRGRGSSRS